MAKQIINVGTSANSGNGDPIRTAFQKAMSNFDELYTGSTSDVDSLIAGAGISVDQATGKAVFDGNVLIGQGALRLSAQKVEVVYRATVEGIASLTATGSVTLVSGADAAEAERADYNIDSGTIVMTGNVLLTQGPSALTAQKMTVNLKDGTARMSGRVKTILQTGSN